MKPNAKFASSRDGAAFAEWMPRLASYLYVIDLVADRVVLELGSSTGVGCEFLANYGARSVIGIDISRSAIHKARQHHSFSNVEYRCHMYHSIEVDDGSVDVAFVPDGMRLMRDPRVLTELRRVVGKRGHVVWTVASADRRGGHGGVSFHEVVDRLSKQFEPVTMVAMSPFVGWAAVEFSGDEPNVELDTSLSSFGAGTDPITNYIAICGGDGDPPARGYTVIQLPFAEGSQQLLAAVGADAAVVCAKAAETGEKSPPSAGKKQSEQTQRAVLLLAQQREKLQLLEDGLRELDVGLGHLPTMAPPHTRIAALSAELGARDAEVAMLTVGLRSLKQRLQLLADELAARPERDHAVDEAIDTLRRLAGDT